MITLTNAEFNRLLSAARDLSNDERAVFEALSQSPCSDLQMFKVNEVAHLFRIHRTTVWRLTEKGILRPVEIFHDTYRYSREDLTTLAKSGYLEVLRQRLKAA